MGAGRVHLIGIGGVGMAGLAVLLKAQGHEVSGCDIASTPRTRWLEGLGIPVSVGHDPAHVRLADVAVVTPAVPDDEPERLAAAKVRMRGEVLAEIVSNADSVAVCGSHGKTTTATWTAKLLKALGEDPSWAIGGETGGFPVAGVGKGPLVVEADESDGTLALYRAGLLVVTNCEYDHPDHFKSESDYRACFDAARRNARQVIESRGLSPVKLGTVPKKPLPDVPKSGSVPSQTGGLSPILGGLSPVLAALAPHNRQNALLAAEVALRRGHTVAEIAAALPAIVAELPDRRFQRLADGVYTDYAHHPTEMACAVQMARRVCKGRLRVLFQPHRHSRTKALLGAFPASFAGADEVVVCPTYAAFEPPVEGGDEADLYAACRAAGLNVQLARSCEEAWTHAIRQARPGDLTLVLGAGDIISKLHELPPTRIWIGAGANTWKSDLDLGVEYAKTDGPAGRPGASLGIPWMAGIPGTVGGWVKMNAGAFGHSVSELVARVKVDGSWIGAGECGFGYRRSEIEGEIQDVEWDESRLAAARAEGGAADYLSRRRKFPAGTFGSVFKNPPGDFAGRLLEEAGAKGLRVGGAYVWSGHANVIVRGDGATPSDVLALARLMRNRVLFRFGVALEPEVCGLFLG
ncbi:MAG: hypothetical protein IKE55_09565 [Kiritimatiellae bacterium]|nr:hypothetical protein [Kiritimatiellia bacterium]